MQVVWSKVRSRLDLYQLYEFSDDRDHRAVRGGYREAPGDEQSGINVDSLEGAWGVAGPKGYGKLFQK